MVEFKTLDEAPMPVGRVREQIPAPLVSILNQTYQSGQVCELEVPEDDQDEFLRLCRLHAKRHGLTIQAREFHQAGLAFLRFRMKDKRSYNRRSDPQETL